MALKVHIGAQGQNIHDLAIFLYKDIRGISELLRLNPAVFTDINLEDYQGQNIIFDDEFKFVAFVSPAQDPVPAILDYSTHEGQTIFDLAIQLFGDINKIGEVTKFITELNARASPFTKLTVNLPDNNITRFFADRTLIIATDTFLAEQAAGNFLLLQDGSFILYQDGGRLELQD